MTEYELTTLVFDLFRDADAQIQFWMQATFAVVVAVFFAGDRLSRGIRRAIASLYLVASVLAALRWTLAVVRMSAYRNDMTAAGFADIPTVWWLVVPVVALIMVMFFGAVVGTLYFLRRPVTGGGVVTETS